MEELNCRGKAFVDEWCNEVHGTTKRIPNQHYLMDEKQLLGVLPKCHLYFPKPQKRIVSPDSFVSFGSNKYSVPVKYACKTVYVRFLYGFRIQVLDKDEKLIVQWEACDEKKKTYVLAQHYEAIAPKVSTSIPQIRRDFTKIFSNGAKYLDAAGRQFEQPTHHARKIMELLELYEADTLNQAIAVAVEENRMDIKNFRMLLKEYNAGTRSFTIKEATVTSPVSADAGESLTRDCDYYEQLTQEANYAANK